MEVHVEFVWDPCQDRSGEETKEMDPLFYEIITTFIYL